MERNIEEIVNALGKRKAGIKRYLLKHFKDNVDYKVDKTCTEKQLGGHNKERIVMREEVYELIMSTYATKYRYIKSVNGMTVVNPMVMSVENATIGFIEECYRGVIEMKRQYKVGAYYVDLYIPEYKIAMECDEYDHRDYNEAAEKEREEYIKEKLGCEFIRFNPTTRGFCLASVMNELHKKMKGRSG